MGTKMPLPAVLSNLSKPLTESLNFSLTENDNGARIYTC